jgi:hypothetical protein
MCGRYTIRELRLLDAALDAIAKQDDEVPPYKIPTYNAGPAQLLPVAYLDDKGKSVIEAMKGDSFQPGRARNRNLHRSMPSGRQPQPHECFGKHSLGAGV